MRLGRIPKAMGVAAAAVLALSACASGNGGSTPTNAAGKTGGKATVAEVNAFSSFNQFTAEGNVDVNGNVGYITHSGFYYVDDKLKVIHNDKFGKYEKIADNPLTVRYTVNEGVKWSDGEAIDAGDLLLSWAVNSAHYDDAGASTGTTYFTPAADTSGLNTTEFPEVGADGRSITLKYAQPYAEWEIAFDVDMPAHVVATKAGLADEKALIELLKSTPRGDSRAPGPVNDALKKVADFWNTGFDTKTLPNDPSLYLSSGPYIVKNIVQDASMTLVKNKDYNWGPEAKLDEITIRYIGSASAQVQALKNREADIIAPQPSADTLEQLKALESDGVTTERYGELAYDHLDLNYTGPFADKNVREAFMMTVPRQDIVEKIVKKLDPGAMPLDSQLFLPSQAKYGDAAKANGSSKYQTADIEGARKLLAGATPEVRIMYNKDNPNRVDAFSLIRESAAKAGFKIVDGGLGQADWGSALGDGSYDATIFGWINSGVGVTGVPQVFKSTAGSNYNLFTDPEADRLMDELIVTTDKAKQDDLIAQVDKRVWDSAYGLPLFQAVGLASFSDRVTGVKSSPGERGIWWNVWDWQVK
ncbi:ABC transporter family substrate-binding protein [Pseudarthrobacter sp. O4]|uniref:ABC transporter family substrate-binding protein n=1 Tax=Pseudarthrobacter sp. O4 TaxID=3418417 RepID=UPI003CF88E71